MSKRHYVRMISIILVVSFVLTGCGNTQQLTELQKNYDSLCTRYSELEKNYNELKSSHTNVLTGCGNTQQLTELQKNYDSLCTRYSELEKDYNELKSSHTRLQEINDLPDIVVSLIDDRNEVVDLTLYSSLESSQKDYTKYYYDPFIYDICCSDYIVTITCNNGEKIDDIYWFSSTGDILSVMFLVDNLDNTYTLLVSPFINYVHSLCIKCNGKNVYTSFYGSSDLTFFEKAE